MAGRRIRSVNFHYLSSPSVKLISHTGSVAFSDPSYSFAGPILRLIRCKNERAIASTHPGLDPYSILRDAATDPVSTRALHELELEHTGKPSEQSSSPQGLSAQTHMSSLPGPPTPTRTTSPRVRSTPCSDMKAQVPFSAHVSRRPITFFLRCSWRRVAFVFCIWAECLTWQMVLRLPSFLRVFLNSFYCD
jgi:hypothetical protein